MKADRSKALCQEGMLHVETAGSPIVLMLLYSFHSALKILPLRKILSIVSLTYSSGRLYVTSEVIKWSLSGELFHLS